MPWLGTDIDCSYVAGQACSEKLAGFELMWNVINE